MKKWILMLLAVVWFAVLPSRGTELGQLHPISLLMVQTEGKTIRVITDTMDEGTGETLDGALRNLEDTTPGHIFLDTAENLLLTEQTRYLLPQLKQLLRPGVAVCVAKTPIDPQTAADYLNNHIPKSRLSDTQEHTPLQELTYIEERYFLEK